MRCPNGQCPSETIELYPGCAMVWCPSCGTPSYPNGSAHYVPAQARQYADLRAAAAALLSAIQEGHTARLADDVWAVKAADAAEAEALRQIRAALDAAPKETSR